METQGSRGDGLKYVELFAGIGGLGAGFRQLGGDCVLAVENDRFAVETYQANHPDVPVHQGDVRKLDAADVPDHDILMGGFPCQPFSSAGVNTLRNLGKPVGLDDCERGNLFWEVIRIAVAKQPHVVLLENTRNFARHDKGRTLSIVLDALKAVGYATSHRVIDAAAWVPQRRLRIYIVAVRDSEPFDFDQVRIPPEDEWPTLASILEDDPPAKHIVSDRAWKGDQAHKERWFLKEGRRNCFGYVLTPPNGRWPTLTCTASRQYIPRPEGNPRRPTPRERARLMGFPDSFRIPVSDTQACKQFGNAVVVPVSRALAEAIIQCL